jgi:hypothetical protein
VSGVNSTFETEAREVRRLDLINGLGRRRWSPKAKAQIVAESLAPGVSNALLRTSWPTEGSLLIWHTNTSYITLWLKSPSRSAYAALLQAIERRG